MPPNGLKAVPKSSPVGAAGDFADLVHSLADTPAPTANLFVDGKALPLTPSDPANGPDPIKSNRTAKGEKPAAAEPKKNTKLFHELGVAQPAISEAKAETLPMVLNWAVPSADAELRGGQSELGQLPPAEVTKALEENSISAETNPPMMSAIVPSPISPNPPPVQPPVFLALNAVPLDPSFMLSKAKPALARQPLSTLKAPEQSQDAEPESELAFRAKLTPKEAVSKERAQISSALRPETKADPAPTFNHLEAEPATNSEQSHKAQPVAQAEKPSAQERKPEQPAPSQTAHGAQPAEKVQEPGTTIVAPAHALSRTDSAKPAEKPALAPALPLEIQESAPPRTEPARDISFRIASHNADPVDVQLTDRAGQIHVSVRSADPALTRSLQDNVTELAGKLERSGFHAETQVPHGTEPSRESESNPGFQDSTRDRRSPHFEQPRPKRSARSNEAAFEISMPQTDYKDNS